jgi:hypothetical protein
MIRTVYLAGPYTGPDPEVNVTEAIRVAEAVSRMGFIPFVPHLFHYWNKVYPHDYGFWMRMDHEYIMRCDALLRFGRSPGANKEYEFAREHGKQLFNSLQELAQYYLENEQVPS